jgi:drug/metabolite transporter (DMT)-like permease
MTNTYSHKNQGYLYAILAALFFGASTPIAKILLGVLNPWLLAGLLYLGAGVGLGIVFIIQHGIKKTTLKEATLIASDWKWLASAILLGGILGPILLMVGLAKTQASTASLLLNLEAVFSVICARVIFKEHVGRRILFGMLCITLGTILLSSSIYLHFSDIIGPLFIMSACLAWAIDNNLTRKISAANPIQLAMIKTLVAGFTNTILAMSFGAMLFSFPMTLSACSVGFIGYGLSLVFYILGLRHLGTARTTAYFSLAPFVGAAIAIAFLRDPLTWQMIFASLLMGFGIWLHLTEEHEHEHVHGEFEHEHRHVHDEHHQHEHSSDDPLGEPHSHHHKHAYLRHTHPHYPDIHHRHEHE